MAREMLLLLVLILFQSWKGFTSHTVLMIEIPRPHKCKHAPPPPPTIALEMLPLPHLTPSIQHASEIAVWTVLEDGNFEDTLRDTGDAAYNLAEGPLWRARLVVCRPEEPCKLPWLKATFPYQYHLIIDVHHCINDGVSLWTLLWSFFMILDGLLDGEQIDDSPIGGKLRDGREVIALEDRIRENLMKDPQRLKALLEERSKMKTRTPLIAEALGPSQEPSPVTCFLDTEILDNKLVEAFHSKCKAHRITFNSGFVGVTNAALVELAREACVVRDSYTISTVHPVDTRRYMSDVKTMVWGNHSMRITQNMPMPRDVRKKFWKYATEFDAKFRWQVKNLGPLEEKVLDTMLQPQSSVHEDKVIHDYMFSNMYSPQVQTFGNGKHVQLTDVFGYIPLTKANFAGFAGIISVRDYVWFLFFYSSGSMMTENATVFIKRAVNVFNDIAKTSD